MNNDTIEYLKNIPPFKELADESFFAISESVSHVEFPQGVVIIEEGAEGDSLYIIKKGEVQVYIKESSTGDKIILSKLNEGDYFGEMALITGEPRSACIETMTPVSLLRLDKEGFEQLIKNNPSISLSLSHMLSQRLKEANIKRLESEKFYHSKISPSGSLSEIPFFEILKFCEQNSLSGWLKLTNEDQHAELNFVKGNVQTITLDDLSEDEAMDKIMQWSDGNFVIEPSLFTIDEEIHAGDEAEDEVEDEESSGEEENTDKTTKKELSTEEVLALLLDKLFARLVAVVGSQVLQDIFKEANKQLEPYFPSLKQFKISIIPQIKIELDTKTGWDEKKTLAVAVLLQSILKACRPMVIGSSFLDIPALAGEYRSDLEKISFFEYMKHANEFSV